MINYKIYIFFLKKIIQTIINSKRVFIYWQNKTLVDFEVFTLKTTVIAK